MNASERMKVWRELNRKLCPSCKIKIVSWDSIKCRSCHMKDRQDKCDAVTLGELRKNKGLTWSTYVRQRARAMYNFSNCLVCDYSNVVEICHVENLGSMPDEATVGYANRSENIVGLCPNHHWDLDHGFLSLGRDANRYTRQSYKLEIGGFDSPLAHMSNFKLSFDLAVDVEYLAAMISEASLNDEDLLALILRIDEIVADYDFTVTLRDKLTAAIEAENASNDGPQNN